MNTIYYKGAWIHENFTDNTFCVQIPIKGDTLYYTKEVKSYRAAQLFITKNQEYINR